ATPFPSNRIVVYARPPVDEHRLAYFGDWIELVVAHELTHVFHLDGAGGLGRVVRRGLARYPWAWPGFPPIAPPLWAVEGIATHMQSALTGVGRVNGSYFDMSLRAAVLEGSFFPIARVTGGTPLWPAGNAAYIYGALFFDDLARRHGTAVDAAVVARTQKSWLPPEVFFDRVGRGTL